MALGKCSAQDHPQKAILGHSWRSSTQKDAAMNLRMLVGPGRCFFSFEVVLAAVQILLLPPPTSGDSTGVRVQDWHRVGAGVPLV